MHLFFKQAGGLLAIKIHVADVRVFFEKANEIIRRQTVRRDGGVKAAGPVTGFDYIPQGNVIFAQCLQTCLILQLRACAE